MLVLAKAGSSENEEEEPKENKVDIGATGAILSSRNLTVNLGLSKFKKARRHDFHHLIRYGPDEKPSQNRTSATLHTATRVEEG